MPLTRVLIISSQRPLQPRASGRQRRGRGRGSRGRGRRGHEDGGPHVEPDVAAEVAEVLGVHHGDVLDEDSEDDVEHVEEVEGGGVEGADVSDLYQDDELCCDEAPDVEEEPLCQQVGSDMIGSGSPPDPRSALDHPGPGRTSHDGHAHAADAGGEGNPVPTQQLQPAFHDGFASRWGEAVLQACADMREAFSRPATSRSIALVSRAGGGRSCLQWVHWDDVHQFLGRVVCLDSANRVIWQHPSTRKSFAPEVASGTLQVLIPNTGVTMVRATGEFRAEMHTVILRVREKVATLVLDDDPPHFDSSAIGSPSSCSCVVCGSVGNSARERPQTMCAFCLLLAHQACANSWSAEVPEECITKVSDLLLLESRGESQPVATAAAVILSTLDSPGARAVWSTSSARCCLWCRALFSVVLSESDAIAE